MRSRVSFTPRISTDWLRVKMPRSKSMRIAFSVIHVISSGALKCV